MALLDQNRIRFPGSGSIVQGNTPFGTYDSDLLFQKDCYSTMIFVARRLGYPNIDVELIDIHFYSAFEEAVNQYSALVNQFNIVNNIFLLNGQTKANLGNITGRAITGAGLSYVINIAKSYGSETGTGGIVDYKKTFIQLQPRVQDYDLQALIGDVKENCNRIEIKKIWHDMVPAAARVYDPFSMTGLSYSNVLQEMGFGAYSPATQFLMCPIFEDLLRIQGIQFNDLVRKSAYSFEIKNNKIRIFPIPIVGCKLWMEYIVEADRNALEISPTGSLVASDFSDMPYSFHTYSQINDPGKQWIRKYTLANCKEILGAIRQKVQSVPTPNGDIVLDGGELRQEAKEEKEQLISDLKEMLQQAGRFYQMQQQSEMASELMETLKGVPTFITIG